MPQCVYSFSRHKPNQNQTKKPPNPACVPVWEWNDDGALPIVCVTVPHVRPVRPVVCREHACRQYSPVAYPRLLTWLELGPNMGEPWRTKEGEGERKLHQHPKHKIHKQNLPQRNPELTTRLNVTRSKYNNNKTIGTFRVNDSEHLQNFINHNLRLHTHTHTQTHALNSLQNDVLYVYHIIWFDVVIINTVVWIICC